MTENKSVDMTDEEMKELLIQAVQCFSHDEKYLLEHNVSERAMAHKLAEHVKKKFIGSDVDCEYNKNIDDEKCILATVDDYLIYKGKTKRGRRLKEEHEGVEVVEDEDHLEVIDVFPDIVIHHRGEGHPKNLVIIEIKKSSNRSETQREFDAFKLRKYTEKSGPLKYRLGAFIDLMTGHCDMENRTHSVHWYINGEQENTT